MMTIVSSGIRQREIVEVLIRHGWDYMRQVLTLGKSAEPDIPTPEILCQILADLGPVYVKLGQLLSTRPDLLPPSYIRTLSSLQTNVPPVEWAEIDEVLRQALPQPPEVIFASIEPQPVAAGSIAQVHKAILQNGQAVALKIQRPGIEAIVEQDITLFKQIATILAGTEFGKRYNIVALAEEFGSSLQSELDFTKEANFTNQLRQNLSQSRWFDPSQIVVPNVYHDLFSKKLLVLEWLEGVPILQAKLDELDDQGDVKVDRRALTSLLFRAFLQQYLVDGFFHADPHPGNIFYLKDGRVGLLDCGMVGALNPRMQSQMVELVLSILENDPDRCVEVTLNLADPMDITQPINLAQLQSDYDRLLRKYYNLSLSNLNMGELLGQIMEAARLNNLRLPNNIGLLTKSFANLEGTARSFDPSINLMEEVRPLMTDLFRQQLIGNDPTRSALQTVLEFKHLSLQSPRQVSFLLNRLASETLKLNLVVQDLSAIRKTIDEAANRRSFSTVVGSLIIGAAIMSSSQQTPQLQLLSTIFFGVASLLGIWLLVTILRSGQVK